MTTKMICPAKKKTCDTGTCVYAKESLCDYPYTAVLKEPVKPENIRDLCRRYGITSWEHNFDSFKRLPGTEAALRAFAEYCHDPYQKPLLVCYGTTGCGKSHLLEALVIEWAYQGKNTRISQFVDITGNLKRLFSNKEESWRYSELMHDYCHKNWCLCWDDIGMGSRGNENQGLTPWEESILEEVVVTRFNEWLPTVLISNLDISALPERVVSRARDKTQARLVLNGGADFRPKKNKQDSEKTQS